MFAFLPLVVLLQASALPQSTVLDDSTPRPIAQMVHTKWSVKDGAPPGVYALGQTSDGYLLVGTRASLFRFDGVRFVEFTPTGQPMAVRSIFSARDGTAWIVWMKGGVSRLRGGVFTTYGEREGLPPVQVVAESPRGAVVAGTNKGLFRLTDGKWIDASADWSYPPALTLGLWFDRAGTLWAQTPDRFLYLPDGAPRFLDPGVLLKRTALKTEFAQTRDGVVWTSEFHRSAHSLPKIGDSSSLTEVMVGGWTLVADRRGSLWIGSYGDGLRRVSDPTRIQHKRIAQFGAGAEQITTSHGLQSNLILTLFEDRDGGIWVGSDRGLDRFIDGAIVPLPASGATLNRSVFALRDSTIWVLSSSTARQLHITRDGMHSVKGTPYASNLFQDSAGELWNANGEVLERYLNGSFTPQNKPYNPEWFLDDGLVDTHGVMWLHDQHSGLLRRQGDTLVRVANFKDAGASVGRLFLDSRGRIWMTGGGHFGVYEADHLRQLDTGDEGKNIEGFVEDHAGTVWSFGAGGVGKYDDSTVRFLAQRQGIGARRVVGATFDEAGALWAATTDGVVRILPLELDHAFADSSYVPRVRTLGVTDGLPGSATQENAPIARSPDGTLWIGADSGVGHLDPRHLPPEVAPPVVIEGARIDGRELPAVGTTTLPPSSHDLEIDYTAAEFSAPQKMQFRYRLEGVDPAWHDAGTRRRAYFTNLGPGRYRFRVAARKGDGDWRDALTSWEFRVLPAWYQTWWFRGLAVLAIGGVFVGGALRVQRRRYLAAQATLRGQYEATIAERARIAQDLHDTLLQGFIGVTLQLKATERSLPPTATVAAASLTQVQQLARDSLREARERVWELKSADFGADNVASALESLAKQRAAGMAVDVLLVIHGPPRRLDRTVENAVFRIGREAIANALQHASPSRIEIVADFGENEFRLDVLDDGRGFTEEEGEEAQRQGHFGLSGARERATALGGRYFIRPRASGGTAVTLELPLTANSPIDGST